MEKKELPNRTLFISGLPCETKTEELSELFGQFGPLRKCFVITNKKFKGSLSGIVGFVDGEDAKKAVTAKHTLKDNPVKASFTKAYDNSATKKTKSSHDKDVQKITSDKPLRCIIRNLPFKHDLGKLREIVSEHGKVLSIEPPAKSNGYRIVKFDSDATPIIEKLNGTEFQGRKITVEPFLLNKKSGKPKIKEKTTQDENLYRKLILRNIPFNMEYKKGKLLREHLVKSGNVMELNLPQNSKGKFTGFGFVVYSTKQEAQNAIEYFQKLDGLERKIVADWAINKLTYDKQIVKSKSHNTLVTQSEEKSSDGRDSESDQSDAEDASDESESGDHDSASGQSEDGRDSNQSEADDSESEVAGSDDEQSENENQTDQSDIAESESDQSEGEDSEMDQSNAEDSENDQSDEDSGEEKEKVTKREPLNQLDSDRTLFIRNLTFEVDDQELGEFFEKFGPLKYAKVVMDPKYNRSRGLGFVQFRKKESADDCLDKFADSSNESDFTLRARLMNISKAVSREEVNKIKNQDKKQPKDNRNLFLAREGLIREGTVAAKGVSPYDLKLRNKILVDKKQRLKDTNIFISPTRLCFHNIPKHITDKQLRALIVKHSDNKNIKITECRIIKDMTKVDTKGVGKSRGFAFVNFTQHDYALSALNSINNQPDIFTNNRRPVVEFSLENIKAVQKIQRIAETNKLKKLENTDAPKSSQADKRKQKNQKITPTVKSLQIKRPEGTKPGLPSHLGPKLRHKTRKNAGATIKSEKRERRESRKREFKHSVTREKEADKQPRPKKARIDDKPDSFDKLVNNYKNKLQGISMNRSSKWYE